MRLYMYWGNSIIYIYILTNITLYIYLNIYTKVLTTYALIDTSIYLVQKFDHELKNENFFFLFWSFVH